MKTHLIQSLRQLDELSDGLGILQALLQSLELLSSLDSLRLSGSDRDDVLARRDRKDVQLVVEDEAVVTRSEGEDESLVESRDDRRVRVRSVSSVDVLR